MKIFSNTSLKSISAVAALMLFASSAAYATCQTDCAAYAQSEATKARDNTYSSVMASCLHSVGPTYYYCNQIALSNAQNAYNGVYSSTYANCTATNCGG